MHAEEQMGRLLGWVAISVGLMNFAVAGTFAFANADGMATVGWMAAGAGWWLCGVSAMATGKDRAKIDDLQQKLAVLTDDRSAE